MNVLSSIAIVLRSVSPIGHPLLLAAVLCLPACAHTLDARPGRLIWGHEVREFTPCGTEQTLWFRGEGEILDPLIAQYQVLTDTPYEAIYVEVTGEVQVDIFHGNDLGITPACGSALDPETGTKTWLSQTGDGLFANTVQGISQTNAGCCLALTRRGRRNRRYQDKLPFLPAVETFKKFP